jgi:hypothetical protein
MDQDTVDHNTADHDAAGADDTEDLTIRLPGMALVGAPLGCAPLPALLPGDDRPDYTDVSVLRAGDAVQTYVTSSDVAPHDGSGSSGSPGNLGSFGPSDGGGDGGE